MTQASQAENDAFIDFELFTDKRLFNRGRGGRNYLQDDLFEMLRGRMDFATGHRRCGWQVDVGTPCPSRLFLGRK